MLPHADEMMTARVITAYAQVFGVALVLAAADFARERRRPVAHHCRGDLRAVRSQQR